MLRAPRAKPRTKSGKAVTVHSKDYPVGRDYDGLLRALEDSYERRGRHEVTLADVKALGGEGAIFRLQVKAGTLEKLSPPIDEGWTVHSQERSARAVVTRIDLDEEQLIVRCTDGRPGKSFAQTITLSAPDFLLRLRDWLQEKQGRPFPRLFQEFENSKLGVEPLKSLTLPDLAVEELREGQLRAMRSLGKGAMHLWGPPGTGKTYTVARAVKCFLQNGYKVALFAPTNVAVDTAVLALRSAFLNSGSPLSGGYLVRAGYPELDELEAYPELMAWQDSLKAQQRELLTLKLIKRELEVQMRTVKGPEKSALLRKLDETKTEEERVRTTRTEELWTLAKNAQILATTVYSALHREEMLAFFGTEKVAVVIDEAGMVPRYSTLPLLELLSGGDAPQGTLSQVPSSVSLLLAGDPRQLAPIYNSHNEKDVNLRYWLGESLMEELLADQSAGNVRQLNEQSRMDPSICQPISRTYYDNRLLTVPDALRPRPPLALGWPGEGLVIVDARKASLPDDAPEESKLRYNKKMNERSLQVAVRLIREALAGGAKRVLWLSPFREQARKARKLVDLHFSDTEVRAGTVHTSQGSEADLVILDPVGIGHRWLRGQIGGELDIERLLNVAVSRARGQVIVFGNNQDLAKNDIFRRLLGEANRWDGGAA